MDDWKKRERFQVRAALVIIGGVWLLLSLSLVCKYKFPKAAPDDLSMQDVMSDLQADKTWWQRFMDNFKIPEKKAKLQRNRKSEARSKRIVEGGGGPGTTVIDRQQRLFRQKVMAEKQLAVCEGRSVLTVLERVQPPFGEYPWKRYELDRLKRLIYAEAFEMNFNPRWLQPFVKSASRAADSQFANFEDYFWAGRANLFAGNLRKARNYLQIAKRRWPVGRGYWNGLIEIMLAVTDAHRDDVEAMLFRVEIVQRVFPDWSLTEIYQSDFEYLQRTYPDKPLVLVLHGKMLAMAFDDAKAIRLYRQAMEMPALRGASREKVNELLSTLEKVHGL